MLSFSFDAEARRRSSKNLVNAALTDSLKEQKEITKRNKRKKRSSDILIRRSKKREIVKLDPGTDYDTLSQREESEVLRFNDKRRELVEDVPMFVTEE